MTHSKKISDGFLDVDGYRLGYTIEGKGLKIVVVGSATYYPRTFSDHLKQYCQFYFIDHRGFASTSPVTSPDDHSHFELEVLVHDIEILRQHLKLDQFIILGHSGHSYMVAAAKRQSKMNNFSGV